MGVNIQVLSYQLKVFIVLLALIEMYKLYEDPPLFLQEFFFHFVLFFASDIYSHGTFCVPMRLFIPQGPFLVSTYCDSLICSVTD